MGKDDISVIVHVASYENRFGEMGTAIFFDAKLAADFKSHGKKVIVPDFTRLCRIRARLHLTGGAFIIIIVFGYQARG
jgi:hypothetical protein